MTAGAEYDAVVVGAGFSGLAVLHLLREQGLRVRAYDAAGDVGGTWWWHAYPGSRLDTECHLYQYAFSEPLFREWGWSERTDRGAVVRARSLVGCTGRRPREAAADVTAFTAGPALRTASWREDRHDLTGRRLEREAERVAAVVAGRLTEVAR